MSAASDQELVDRVTEITGASLAEAKHLLGACNNDAEAAVALFFEKGGAEDVENGNGANPIPIDDDEDGIRAPIAPIREQMIGPEDDNFMAGIPANAPRFVRPSQRIKICPLRDFAREGALMEEQLQAAYNNGISTSNLPTEHSTSAATTRRRARATFVATSVEALQNAPPGSSRLGDLYRPPTDIAYAGTFQAARNRAMAVKHWLLVNIQNDNFDSQLLNRDVWSNKELRKLVRKRFILWQIDSESIEGRRFITFYHCNKIPYVCVIDPRTGEEVWKSAEPKEANLLQDIKTFVNEHNDFANEAEDDDTPTTSKRAAIVCDESPVRSEIVDADSNPEKRPKILELTEDEQIALAIRNSIRENGIKAAATSSTFNGKKVHNIDDDDDDDNNSEFGSVEEFDEDEDDNYTNTAEKVKKPRNCCNFEEQLGSAKDDLTMLKLRLLNKEGTDETVQLRWPSDTRLQVLRLYLEQKHSHLTQRNYKLICAFPRKTLSTADDVLSLKELGLHPSANIHITDDD